MSRVCPQCSSEIDDDRSLCPVCFFGEGLKGDTVECVRCHSDLDDDARFCSRCGATVAASRPVEGDPIRAALAMKLEGQYRIARLLGRGGMGSVYLARDLTLDREVAIKVIKTATDSREMFERFRREARTAAKLSHPNIVPLHTFGEVEGMLYFVMGYVRGESLADRLRRDGQLPEEEARRIFAEIADALDHAHRQGVVHRDVKPDNVLLEDESGRALLTDFGLAKAVGTGDTLTRLGTVVGTPHYMSPEQASGRSDIDARSDIYSLGVTAYAMLAGRVPFEGKTPAEVLTKHLTQEPPALRSLAAGVSDSISQAVERCLAKDPAARWPDARSLARTLGATEAIQLPDSLHAVDGRGFAAALGIAVFLIIWLVPIAREDRLEALGIALSTLSGIAFCYVFLLASLRREGFSIGQSQSVIWREPSWWLFWYPRALRRRGNVWDRLPAALRQFRNWSAVVVVIYLVSGVVGLLVRVAHLRVAVGLTGYLWMSIVAASMVIWFLFRHRAKRALRGKGLGGLDLFRVLLSTPPSRAPFWARPHIAAILTPPHTETSRRTESPHDHLQSILCQAGELSGPLRPLGTQAAIAARQLLASIDHADREIADLARNVEPGEEERLAIKIDALSGAGDDSAPMRTLLEKQLELIRGLSARVEEAKERRSRRVEMLRTLALHVASLRARQTDTPSELRQISDNVRSLCDDIGRQAATLDTLATAGNNETPTIEQR